jgi:pyruvate ferredoxin oxidoreductase beta subunit/2-oxoisovalerate ferredoxin oxidoreductase beta subunit
MMPSEHLEMDTEYMHPGHVACPGCGAAIAMKFALKGLGPKTMFVIPACCWAIIAGMYPQNALKMPILHIAFAAAAAAASGLKASLDARGEEDATVVVWAGDGGTFDIGFQSLSGAVERNEDFIYVCYDNEAYMNTGVQRSSATPFGTSTTTTPGSAWKNTRKKNIMEALAAHRISYAATANIAYPGDMILKFQKAQEKKGGSRFIHIFASCPTGWGMASDMAVKISRLAVQSNFFPLYEIEDGVKYTINEKGNRPVGDYLKTQRRFRNLTDDDIGQIQELIDEDWRLLLKKAGEG